MADRTERDALRARIAAVCGWSDPYAPGGATCNRPPHADRWHRETRDGKIWAEWSGGVAPTDAEAAD
jgi:hypothetical protein